MAEQSLVSCRAKHNGSHPPGPWRRVGWLALLALRPLLAVPASAQQVPHAFENVTVVPMTGEESLPGHTVVVRAGRIVAMGPSSQVEVPTDAVRVDGQGRYLAPGLADMHVRLPAEDDPLRVVVLEETLFLFLANGVTTIRATAGSPYQLALRDDLERDEILGPTLYLGSPLLDGTAASTPGSAGATARAHREAGYDFLSVEPGLSGDAWDAVVEAAGTLALPIGGRAPEAVGVAEAIEDGISTIDGLEGYLEATRQDDLPGDAPLAQRFRATDRRKLDELARATAAAGVYVVPSQYLSHHLFGWNDRLGGRVDADSIRTLPEFQYVPQSQRDGWSTDAWNLWSSPRLDAAASEAYVGWRRDLLSALLDADVDILLGTMSASLFNVPGFAVHRELPLMVDAGMTPYEALAAATRSAARYVEETLGKDGTFGVVAVGGRADLLLLDEDPLTSVAALERPAGVMVRGTWLTRSAIEERLQGIATRHKDYDTD